MCNVDNGALGAEGAAALDRGFEESREVGLLCT